MMRRPITSAWTDQENETLRTMAAQGKSKLAICGRLHRSIQAIERQAKALGLTLQPRPRPISYEELDRQRKQSAARSVV